MIETIPAISVATGLVPIGAGFKYHKCVMVDKTEVICTSVAVCGATVVLSGISCKAVVSSTIPLRPTWVDDGAFTSYPRNWGRNRCLAEYGERHAQWVIPANQVLVVKCLEQIEVPQWYFISKEDAQEQANKRELECNGKVLENNQTGYKRFMEDYPERYYKMTAQREFYNLFHGIKFFRVLRVPNEDKWCAKRAAELLAAGGMDRDAELRAHVYKLLKEAGFSLADVGII